MTDHRGQFDITDIDPLLIIRTAFDMSVPQGMGILQHRSGGIGASEMARYIARDVWGSYHVDYMRGRSMKLHFRADRETKRLYFDIDWYDHTRDQAEELMRLIKLPDVENQIIRAREEREAQRLEWQEEQQHS